MNVALLKDSKFLRKEDVGDGLLLTIRALSQENVAMQGAEPDLKYCVHFDEVEKPCVMNGVNAQMIAKITGQEDTDNWTGKQVILYNDPNVSFGGRVIGGIRCRAPQKQAASPSRPASASPAAAGGSVKLALKNKFKSHPDFGGAMTADSINAYLMTTFGAKMDGLTEEQAKDAMASFDEIATASMDDIPFSAPHYLSVGGW